MKCLDAQDTLATLALCQNRRSGALWRDLALPGAARRPGERCAAVSDVLPLWAGVALCESEQAAALEAVRGSGLLAPGGVLTTTCSSSTQQWDAPNAWPPLQYFLDKALRALVLAPGARQLADQLRDTWLHSCHTAWAHTGFVYEKMDAHRPGHHGGGGEYEPQIGFGWSIGVALQFLRDRAIDRAAQPRPSPPAPGTTLRVSPGPLSPPFRP